LPSEQGRSLKTTTTIDYNGGFDILSRAARQRLSGIVCTIGKNVICSPLLSAKSLFLGNKTQ
jgi:hypothetical protein